MNSGKPSCCGHGGAWFGKCGDDAKSDHTWSDGVDTCKAKPASTVRILACPKCGLNQFQKRTCCGSGGTWFGKCGDNGDPNFDHTWTEGIQACATTPMTITDTAALLTSLPCDQPSDFDGKKILADGNTCHDHAVLFLPTTPRECSDSHGLSSTKADALKYLYSNCCKPGSEPNGVCGLKLTTPCDQPSNFMDGKKIDGNTCRVLAATSLPSTLSECSEKRAGGTETKAEVLKYLHSKCCKQGSKPNRMCGLKTGTPCESKAKGIFLPDAK